MGRREEGREAVPQSATKLLFFLKKKKIPVPDTSGNFACSGCVWVTRVENCFAFVSSYEASEWQNRLWEKRHLWKANCVFILSIWPQPKHTKNTAMFRHGSAPFFFFLKKKELAIPRVRKIA